MFFLYRLKAIESARGKSFFRKALSEWQRQQSINLIWMVMFESGRVDRADRPAMKTATTTKVNPLNKQFIFANSHEY